MNNDYYNTPEDNYTPWAERACDIVNHEVCQWDDLRNNEPMASPEFDTVLEHLYGAGLDPEAAASTINVFYALFAKFQPHGAEEAKKEDESIRGLLAEIVKEWGRQKGLFPELSRDGWMEDKIKNAESILNKEWNQKNLEREAKELYLHGPNGPTGHGDECHSDADPGF